MTAGVPRSGPEDRQAAAAQLDRLEEDRAGLADRLVQPWWWDVSLGLLLFGFFGSCSFHATWVIVAAAVALFAGVALLKAVYQRITGTWWDARTVGPVQGRVRRVTRWWLAGYLTVLVLGCTAEYLLDVRGAMIAAGAVLGLAAGLLSRWVSRIYVAGLRAEL
jgi:cobalamin synthase